MCSKAEFKRDGGKSFNVGPLQLVVFRSDGQWFATSSHCTHEDESLADGWLEGCHVECPRHGAMFDLATGEALSLPATEPLQTFAVEVRGDEVLVLIPAAAPADGGTK
ncbi:non-heme iron oxygenase ferredoxin subunit [candidate division KSB1 bacterium]|nr:non-heme iron oxygenase ferredoxin subunit [candidate division KSB1 bacterium]